MHMKLPNEFEKDIGILEPFIFRYRFSLAELKTTKGSSGVFTKATYVNDRKKIIICIRSGDKLDQLDYQFGDYKVMHGFYLDEICRPDDRRYGYTQIGFEKVDLLDHLKKILGEFEYLIRDFFVGQCTYLKRAAEFQSLFYKELNEKGRAEEELKIDRSIIAKARQQFKDRNYQCCIDIYKTLSKNYVLTEFDKLTLQRCNDHLKK